MGYRTGHFSAAQKAKIAQSPSPSITTEENSISLNVPVTDLGQSHRETQAKAFRLAADLCEASAAHPFTWAVCNPAIGDFNDVTDSGRSKGWWSGIRITIELCEFGEKGKRERAAAIAACQTIINKGI